MHCRLAAERAILVLFKLSSNVLAVLVCSIVLLFAVCALQGNDFYGCLFLACHFRFSYKNLKKLPSGIGPLTSSLPTMCSTD